MRISSSYYFERGLVTMQRNQLNLSDTQQQIASGIKILQPADDPIATLKILRLEEELALNDQFKKNIDFATSQAELEETTLDGITNVIQRVRELAIQANNGTLSSDDRGAIGFEIRERTRELQSLMNTKSSSGEYLFSGFQTFVKPFIDREGGGYQFAGDSGQRNVQVTPNTQIAVSDSGKYLFEEIPSINNFVVTSAARGNSQEPGATISVGNIVEQNDFDDVFPEDYVIEFRPLSEGTPSGTVNYSIYRKSDGHPVMGTTPAVELTNINFAAGQAIEFNGIEVTLYGAPEEGDLFFVESTPNMSLLTNVDRLATALEDIEAGEEVDLGEVIATSLDNFNNIIDRVSEKRSELGARLNSLETYQTVNSGVDLKLREFLSKTRDVDMAEAITTLRMQEMTLQASQSSFVRITSLSLFNYL